MQSENLLNINLAHAAEAAKRLDIELTDRFFADLEQEEISGGDIHAEIFVKASAGDIFTVKIALKGQVTVACDRCLDPLTLDVDTSDTLKIKDADPEDCDADDLLYLDASNPCYDLSWVPTKLSRRPYPCIVYMPQANATKTWLATSLPIMRTRMKRMIYKSSLPHSTANN